MIQCEIAVANKNSIYMHQIITGFASLEKSGKLKYTIKEDRALEKEFYHNAIIELKFKGRLSEN